MPAPLELPEPCRLLHELPAVLRLRGEHLLDLALPDDRVHRGAEPDVREQLDEVGSAHRGTVDEVLALRAADEPSRDRDLAEVERGPRAVLVREHELDLAVLRGLTVAAAGEEDVVRLLRTELRRRQRARRPDDGVRDVRLARPVRTDDHRNALLELQLERLGERLEAADAERAQVHRGPFSRPGRTARRATRSPRGRPPARRAPVALPPARRLFSSSPCRSRAGRRRREQRRRSGGRAGAPRPR